MSFKKSQIALQTGVERVSPDELDAYEVYTVINPSTEALGPQFMGTAAVGGTSSVQALVVTNKYPDYPRNLTFVVVGTGAGMAGTLVLNGKDQFGSTITETFATGTAANGGTVSGTRVFGQITSGTVSLGTAVGNGTSKLTFTPGTNCLFGLPVKIGATTDVVHYGMSAGTGPISVGGGTAIGSLVNTAVHAFRPFAAFGGSTNFNVWVKSTYNSGEIQIAKATQAS
jgi:hypothetical protein